MRSPGHPLFEIKRSNVKVSVSLHSSKCQSSSLVCSILEPLLAIGIPVLGGITVRSSDLRSSGHGFDSRSGRYQAT